MVSAPASDRRFVPETVTRTVKVVIAGAFGVGKTTFIGAVSEITPLRTEELMTQAGADVDDLTGVHGKTTTTVALDFGRLTLSEELALYLFGMPGQARFAELWSDLTIGALGALVLVDSRYLERSFDVLSAIENLGLPYAVALNRFDDTPAHSMDDLKQALDLDPATPLITCDARDRKSATHALIDLAEYLFHHAQEQL